MLSSILIEPERPPTATRYNSVVVIANQVSDRFEPPPTYLHHDPHLPADQVRPAPSPAPSSARGVQDLRIEAPPAGLEMVVIRGYDAAALSPARRP